MSPQGPSCFGYRVRQVEGEWRWTAFDVAGGVRAEGRAKTRAAAAAQLIRTLAEDSLAELKDRAA